MTDMLALKLDAFTYQQFADGRTVISGGDGKLLSPGLYAIAFGGRETIVQVVAQRRDQETSAALGFTAAERERRKSYSDMFAGK